MSFDTSLTPTLILGCEEPELYQHPPQARHLAQTLLELSQGNAQVLITTHSPYFIDVDFFDGIKVVRNASGEATVFTAKWHAVLDGYNDAFTRPIVNENQARTKLAIQTQPKFNEIFFADKVVLIEGISDLACFETYLRLSSRKPDFQKSGTAFVVCEGKSSLALMLLIAKSFSIPFHVVFDCDANCQAEHAYKHLSDNNAVMILAGHDPIEGFPDEPLFHQNLTAWVNNIEDVLNSEFGPEREPFEQAGQNAVGNIRNARKQPMYIAAAMSAAWEAGKRFPHLSRVIDNILA